MSVAAPGGVLRGCVVGEATGGTVMAAVATGAAAARAAAGVATVILQVLHRESYKGLLVALPREEERQQKKNSNSHHNLKRVSIGSTQ